MLALLQTFTPASPVTLFMRMFTIHFTALLRVHWIVDFHMNNWRHVRAAASKRREYMLWCVEWKFRELRWYFLKSSSRIPCHCSHLWLHRVMSKFSELCKTFSGWMQSAMKESWYEGTFSKSEKWNDESQLHFQDAVHIYWSEAEAKKKSERFLPIHYKVSLHANPTRDNSNTFTGLAWSYRFQDGFSHNISKYAVD